MLQATKHTQPASAHNNSCSKFIQLCVARAMGSVCVYAVHWDWAKRLNERNRPTKRPKPFHRICKKNEKESR